MSRRSWLALLVLAFPLPIHAATVTWAFAEQVRRVNVENPATLAALSSLGVSEGSAFSGQLVFESTTADNDASPDRGQYEGAVLLYEITIASLHAEFQAGEPFNQIVVYAPLGFSSVVGNGPAIGSLLADPVLGLARYSGLAGPFKSSLLLVPRDLGSPHQFDTGAGSGFGTGNLLAGAEGEFTGELLSLGRFALLAPLSLALAALSRRSW